ncbi:MAG TPA: phosphoribosylglycinamide formyltransferase [Candidatus Thalassarchaeaceae archaeon]|nr:phosphoribosylglycinamide formyltransferase [Candidatus Thalassarchaeaceae archaeon]|tara:strand:- start:3926 stop:4561 length:636 start_codon:yes stop_codon:yes gene_type:complete
MERGFVLPRIGTAEDPVRIGVLISGGGSGLAALLKHQLQKDCSHKTALVVSNRDDAGGLNHARDNLVDSYVIQIPEHQDRVARRLQHEEEIHKHLISSNVELVVLSGYMRILSPWFVRQWKGRLVNIHPSLLPSFPGANSHRDVLAAGVDRTGCTVHLVDEGIDSGPILAQRSVNVLPDDSEATLQDRVKEVEHRLYPETLDLLCSGQVTL